MSAQRSGGNSAGIGLGAVASLLLSPSPFGILSIVATVAAFVYVLDVRPALASVTRRR